ncbi:MAG: DUF2188 domain-containing protein [Actinobacteria bacterium]|nr:DUF2188 domain-containing protein [Actinomycetota bacterium]
MRIRAEEVVHVLPHAEGWALAPSPTGQPFAVFLNRQFAIRAGQAMAVRSGRELVVHGHDGAVEVVVGAAESRRMLRKPLLGRRRGRPRAMRPERPDQASVTCLLDVRIAYAPPRRRAGDRGAQRSVHACAGRFTRRRTRRGLGSVRPPTRRRGRVTHLRR